MARATASVTFSNLALERKHDEDVIVATAAMKGERVLAIVRICMWLMWGLANIIGGKLDPSTLKLDTPRMVCVYLYWVFAITSLTTLHLAVRRIERGAIKASIRANLIIPAIATLFDFSMVAFMEWRDIVTDRYYPVTAFAACIIFVSFTITRFSIWHVVEALVLSTAVWVALSLGSHATPLIPITFGVGTQLAVGAIVLWVNSNIRKMFVDVRRRDNLMRFLPRQIADRAMNNEALLRPRQHEVTVLFTDIRDFTSLSENLPPREVMEFLDEYFSHMSQIVKGHDGVVNKFLGDGMLAVWGVPDHDDRHAEKALRAALDMRIKLVEFNQQRAQRGQPAIRMGFGLHSGLVAAGMLGGADQHEYTVIGDAVNLASRIEGLTKTLGTDLLVSQSTWDRLSTRFSGTRAGEEKVKGRQEPVVVYTVQGLAPAAT